MMTPHERKQRAAQREQRIRILWVRLARFTTEAESA